MEYFESYILKNTNHYKLSYKQLYDILIFEQNKKIINQSVYNKTEFQELFQYINTNELDIIPKSREELMQFFPVKSKPFKVLSHSLKKCSNQNIYNLIFIKTNFLNKQNIKQNINQICENKKQINIDKLYEALQISNAVFMPSNNKSIENKYKPSILWMNKNKLILEDLFHEFIHYLEWIDQIYLSGNINDKLYFTDINIMNQFCLLFNLTVFQLQYIFDKIEYQTLLNDFLNLLVNLKLKYFIEYSGNQFARYITFNVTKKQNETDIEYLNRIKNFKYFNQLNQDLSLAMIIGYNLIGFKYINIRNHIFGKFNN